MADWIPKTMSTNAFRGCSKISNKGNWICCLQNLSVYYCMRLCFSKTQMLHFLDMPQGPKFPVLWFVFFCLLNPWGESSMKLSCFRPVCWAQECAYRIAWRSIWRKVPGVSKCGIQWQQSFGGVPKAATVGRKSLSLSLFIISLYNMCIHLQI